LYRNGSKFLGRRFLLFILHCVFSFHEIRLSRKGRLLLSKTLSQNSKLRKMSPCPDVPLTVVNLVGPTTVCRTERLSLCSMCTGRLRRDAARLAGPSAVALYVCMCVCVCVSAGGSATGADAAHRSSVSADVVLLRHARHPRHDAAECTQLRSVNQSTCLLLASISSAQLVKLLHTGTD